MFRRGIWLTFLAFADVLSVGAQAQPPDLYFDQDLQSANADPRYAHLAKASEKVRVYRLHHYAPGNWDALDPNFDGVIDAGGAATLRASAANAARPAQPKQRSSAAAVSKAAVSAPTRAAGAASQQLLVKSKPTSTADDSLGQWVLYVRKDFTDIYSISAPNAPASSVGATFSYTNDRIAKNTTWSGQGAVFGGYNYLAPQFGLNGQPYILGLSAGPYYTMTRVFNSSSAAASKNADTQTYGAVAELALGNVLCVDRFNEFTRVGVGGVQDNIKDTSSLSATADFIPVYDPLLIHYPHFIKTSASSYVGFRFDPNFRIQYDSVEGKNQILLFSNRTKSLRVGPQFGLWLLPFDSVPYLENMNVNVVYHLDTELYSRQNLHWFETDLTYKLNPSFGVTATYKNGRDENTGASSNLYMVSLSSALDYCLPACAAAASSGGGAQ